MNEAKVDKVQADATNAYNDAAGGGSYSNVDQRKLRAAGLAEAPQNVKDIYLNGDGTGANEAGDANGEIVRAWLESNKSGGDGADNDPLGIR